MSPTVAAAPLTFAELADRIRAGEDATFVVRLLRELVLRAGRSASQHEIDEIHAEPASTGSLGWDSVLAGVGWMSGRDRVSSPSIVDWCFARNRYSDDLFDPLDSGKYQWLDYLRTPIELRERNVILPAGNLEGR